MTAVMELILTRESEGSTAGGWVGGRGGRVVSAAEDKDLLISLFIAGLNFPFCRDCVCLCLRFGVLFVFVYTYLCVCLFACAFVYGRLCLCVFVLACMCVRVCLHMYYQTQLYLTSCLLIEANTAPILESNGDFSLPDFEITSFLPSQ